MRIGSIGRPRPSWGAGLLAGTVGLAVPLALALAWIPVRGRLPNTDLALVLVVAVTAIGGFGRRSAVVMSAVSAALWFEFFDTFPYERLVIARNPDIETTLVLACVALVGGELAARAAWHRGRLREENEKLASLRSAAELVTSGEELVRVIEGVVARLTTLLHLESCRFESGDAPEATRRVTRDGVFVEPAVSLEPDLAERRALAAELPVVAQGCPVGRFVLEFAPGAVPSTDRLQVAVTLADHVGAAFLAQAPPPLPPEVPEPERGLRLLRVRGEDTSSDSPAAAHPTAGLSCDASRMIS